ncbi:deoxyribose-phosphate aldolase [Brachyspira pilosicoli WesB]|uniref:Deoxyribose-phosphate aldolase n=1 Tax=Brachyspira pilosicoli WesB TaxID=1161918 RepID=K0JKR2_BRAPL|nr:deoxyribose-phosphate aldolase [Brachyspira pilosicoli]CCG57647.1 deoxyribose-phosphate aldolase [Brachyspira pilosicoli WesB]
MNSSNITKEELCRMFDHTFLKAFASIEDFKKLCSEAVQYNFAMVAINSYPVKLCKSLVKNSDVHVGAAISFPLGQTTLEDKIFEIEQAAKNGADEIDYVINIGELKNNNYDYIKLEMEKIVETSNKLNLISKVIFENCYLTKDEIKKVASIAKEVKPNFIKTSTGFGTSGALVEDIKLMKDVVGNDVKVKASGGISSWEVCKQMIDAGAERIGTSNSIKILNEFLEASK